MAISPELLESVARLKLELPPVAVAFVPTPPAGLDHIDRPLPAGCSYWKHASEGHAFYTLPEDHQNCTVGAYTHGVTLPPEKAEELNGLIGTMAELQYIKKEEVSGIPRRDTPMAVAAYAPLAKATFDPETIIFRGTARQIMLVSEAARAAGVFESGAAMGRPACAMLPQASESLSGIASVGCIGNRVYTDLADGEMYFTVPGKALARVLERLDIIISANVALEAFHRDRAAALA